MYISNSDLTMYFCEISSNTANEGGGIASSGSSVDLYGSSFSGNSGWMRDINGGGVTTFSTCPSGYFTPAVKGWALEGYDGSAYYDNAFSLRF